MSGFSLSTKSRVLPGNISCPHLPNMPVNYQVKNMTKVSTILPPQSQPKQQENNESTTFSDDEWSLKKSKCQLGVKKTAGN